MTEPVTHDTAAPPAGFEAVEELKRLKYRYLTALDTKEWDDFAATLTEDVIAVYGERLSFTGREAVVGYMSGTLSAGILTAHLCHHPDLVPDLAAGTASGRWTLEDTVIVPEYRFLLRGAAVYTDTYRRDDEGRWRIASTSYRRLYEYTLSLDDVPSFTLTSGG